MWKLLHFSVYGKCESKSILNSVDLYMCLINNRTRVPNESTGVYRAHCTTFKSFVSLVGSIQSDFHLIGFHSIYSIHFNRLDSVTGHVWFSKRDCQIIAAFCLPNKPARKCILNASISKACGPVRWFTAHWWNWKCSFAKKWMASFSAKIKPNLSLRVCLLEIKRKYAKSIELSTNMERTYIHRCDD